MTRLPIPTRGAAGSRLRAPPPTVHHVSVPSEHQGRGHQAPTAAPGFLLEGSITLVEGGPIRADGIVVTSVMRDEKSEVLDVLAGTARVRPRDVPTGVIQVGHRLEFRLLSDMPLGKEVASVDVLVEVLPGAAVASPPQP